MYGYYYGYSNPGYHYVNTALVMSIVIGAAALVGLVLFFTLFRKKNEGRFRGFTGKIYDFFNFGRFYTEDISRMLYIVGAFAATAGGICLMFLKKFIWGLLVLILGNIFLRLVFELIIILMVITRRAVSIDKRLSKIEKFYGDEDLAWNGADEEMPYAEEERPAAEESGNFAPCYGEPADLNEADFEALERSLETPAADGEADGENKISIDPADFEGLDCGGVCEACESDCEK